MQAIERDIKTRHGGTFANDRSAKLDSRTQPLWPVSDLTIAVVMVSVV